jgi:hypothetical protein
MGFAVGRAEKGKGSGGGLGDHIDRTKGKEYTYPHADVSRTHLNQNYAVPEGRHKMELKDAISDRIEKGYNGKRKVRNDAVRYLKHVYTGSPEEMKKIFSDKNTAEAWVKANAKFISEEYGKENIVRLTLHLDEKTPHLHAITVPLTKDGRLSAKEIMGNKKDLSLRQDRYAAVMKPFGLNRGIKGTGIKHENANDYYKRIDNTIKTSVNDVLEPVKGVFGINKDKTIEKYQNELKSSKMALEELERKRKYEKLKADNLQKAVDKRTQKIIELQDKSKEMQGRVKERNSIYEANIEILKKAVLNPELETSKHLKKIIAEKEQKKKELLQKKAPKIERKRGKGFGL